MDLSYFELIFKELTVYNGLMEIRLQDMLVRSRGIYKIGGYDAINFEATNEDVDPIFIRIVQSGEDGIRCLRWDNEKEVWDDMGKVLMSNEWKSHYFKDKWKLCGIIFRGGEMKR